MSYLSFDMTTDFFGRPDEVDEVMNIEQHVTTLIATPLGSLVLRPEFGSRVPYLMGERMDDITQRLLAFYAKEAIESQEERISNVETAVTTDAKNNIMHLYISYQYLQTEREMVIDLFEWVANKPPVVN